MKAIAGITASAVLLVATPSFATDFTDPCHCPHCGGTDRWLEKTDTASATAHPNPAKPSDLIGWNGPGGNLSKKEPGAKRGPREEKWYSVTAVVMAVKAEKDGDVHLKLADVGTDPNKKPAKKDRNHPPKVLYIDAEIPPVGTGELDYDSRTKDAPWCALRKAVFDWTSRTFPFSTENGTDITLNEHPIVTIVGKAFYDIDHAPSPYLANRRPGDLEVDGWEIHPVMAMTVDPASIGKH
jgi:hypothetical protein